MKNQVPLTESPASNPMPIVFATVLGSTAQMSEAPRADSPTKARVPAGLAANEKRATKHNPPVTTALPRVTSGSALLLLRIPPTALASVALTQRVRRFVDCTPVPAIAGCETVPVLVNVHPLEVPAIVPDAGRHMALGFGPI